MRKFLVALSIVAALSCAACAKIGTSTDGSATISASDALTQAQGAASAIATLSQTSPMDDATKAQIQGYAAWADFALKAAGIVAAVAGM